MFEAIAIRGTLVASLYSCLISKHVGLETTIFFTARKRSCGKVVFLHLSVILFTAEARMARGACMAKVGGTCVQERRPLKRAVRILLECILV